MRKLIVLIILIVATVPRGISLYWESNGNFHPQSVRGSLGTELEWIPDKQNLSKTEVSQILSQPFHFLGKGAQCYAFGNGDWVLKLVKWRHLRPHPAYSYLPSWGPIKKWKKASSSRRVTKLNLLFTGLKTAANHYSQETGIGYVHLKQTSDLDIDIKIFDLKRMEYTISADETYWVLQRRMQPLSRVLRRHLKMGELEEIRDIDDQLVSLIMVRAERGVFDNDPLFLPNHGVREGKVMLLDVGQLRKEERPLAEQLEYSLQQFREYLQKEAPVLADYLNEKIRESTCAI